MNSLRLLVTEPLAEVHPVSSVLGELVSPSCPLTPLPTAAACGLLREVSFGLSDLLAGRKRRTVITLPTDSGQLTGAPLGAPWELAIERRGEAALVSLFRQGACPEVAQWQRSLPLAQARDALLSVLQRLGRELDAAGRAGLPVQRRGLTLARQQLTGCPIEPETASVAPQPLHIESAVSCALSLSAQLSVTPRPHEGGEVVSRSDLHALLFCGRLSLSRAGNTRHFERVHLFLLLEQLLGQLMRALSCAELAAAYSERRVVAGMSSDMRMNERGLVSWRLVQLSEPDAGWQLPQMPIHQLAAVIGSLSSALCRRLLELDPAQRSNLRLDGFRKRLERVDEHRRRAPQPQQQLNVSPESYRAFAEAETPHPAQVAAQVAVRATGAERLRYSESWRADVPGIDLRTMFLVGNAVLVGSTREVACIERNSGALIWRQTMPRAASVLTAVGLVRLSPRGDLTLHDLRDGQPIETLQLSPSVGGSTRGTVVRAPGLPNMLLVADGAEHLTAIDLDAVEVRWQRPLERLGPVHLRRAGKLLVVTSGSATMLALDLLTGEVVWRRSSAHRYRQPVVVDQSSIFALASGDGHGRGLAIQHIDPWTGAERWAAPLKPGWRVSGPLLACTGSVAAVTQDGERRGLVAFDRDSGSPCFEKPRDLCHSDASCLAIDDLVVANSAGGELVALDAGSGQIRYRHVFASRDSCSGDRPDSLMPVLRAGALFVPQTEVYVLRPHDGRMIGTLPADLIADALRVDERCGVYVAEQSGYVAAYHASTRLRLVSSV